MNNLKFRVLDTSPKAHPAPFKFWFSEDMGLDVFFRWVKEYNLLDKVQQFSGQQDSKGKDIYVGDIIEFYLEPGDLVQKEVIMASKGFFGMNRGPDHSPWLLHPFAKISTVIGNIDMNPELLDPNTVYNLEGKPVALRG